MIGSLILPILIVVIGLMMFFSVRKQKRNQQAQKNLQNSITPGDEVMTSSGLYGTVVSTSDDTIDLEIAPDMITTWLRQAIQKKVADGESEYDADVEHDPGSDGETDYELDGNHEGVQESVVDLEKGLETSSAESLEQRKN
jgi:preprotein translocase subunit YajC